MIVEMSRGVVAVAAAAVLAAGCGGHEPTQSNREWMANARGVVEQLRADVLSVSGFDELAAARRGLRDDSELYGLLVSYTDFGGCLHMVAAVGAEPPGRARVVKLLHRACLHLRRADRLFTSAVEQKDPHLLVTATGEALSAVPVLDDAALELAE
jgi:hypothetical protein